MTDTKATEQARMCLAFQMIIPEYVQECRLEGNTYHYRLKDGGKVAMEKLGLSVRLDTEE